MKVLKQARDLLGKHKIEQAIELLEPQIPSQYQKEYLFLASTYTDWKKQSRLGFNPPEARLFKIIYGFLKLTSNIEIDLNQGMKTQHSKMKLKFESDLYNGYDVLIDLLEEGTQIDLILDKIIKYAGRSTDQKETSKIIQLKKEDLERIIEKKIAKHTNIYKFIGINLFTSFITILIMPFLTNGENLFDEILQDLGITNEDDDDDDDQDLDMD